MYCKVHHLYHKGRLAKRVCDEAIAEGKDYFELLKKRRETPRRKFQK